MEDFKQVVEMVRKLTKTRPPSTKAMFIWVEKIVVLKVCNEVSSDHFFKYLDDMGCQCDRSVVDSIQAPKYGVTDTDRLPHRLPDFKSRRTIFRFVLDCIIGYLNRFGYLKIGFGYLKIGFGYLRSVSVI